MTSVKKQENGVWSIAPKTTGTYSLTLQGSKDAKKLTSSIGGRDLGDCPEFAELFATELHLGRLDWGCGPAREVTKYTMLGEPNEILELKTMVEGMSFNPGTLAETYKIVLKDGALETVEQEDKIFDRETILKHLAMGARNILENAPESVLADKELMMAALAEDPYCLKFVAENLRDDKDVMMAAFSSKKKRLSGELLEFAAKRLRADKDVVKAAVTCQESGRSIVYASESLRADQDIRAAAQTQCSIDISTIL